MIIMSYIKRNNTNTYIYDYHVYNYHYITTIPRTIDYNAITIPIPIFKNPKPLCTLTRWLHNQGLSSTLIARLLNRTQQAVWISIQNSESLDKQRATTKATIRATIRAKTKAMTKADKLKQQKDDYLNFMQTIQTKTLSIPITIFSNRDLSIMEHVVIFLSKQGISITNIAKLLQRNPKTIYTWKQRALAKLKGKTRNKTIKSNKKGW